LSVQSKSSLLLKGRRPQAGKRRGELKRHIIQVVLQLSPAIFALTVWQIAVSVAPHYDFSIGSPAGIIREFLVLVENGNLLRDLGITTLEATLGFMAGSVFGTVVGLTMWLSKTAFMIARPYLVALGAVPVFALGPVRHRDLV
jgi:NitT/TauT family transport system permease protein